MSTIAAFATTLGCTLAFMSGVWLLSVVRRDASIVDVFWGVGFVCIAALSCGLTAGCPARKSLVVALVAVWGLRLSAYLLWRNWGAGEDFRYRSMRAHYGARFAIVSLFTVFGLQGVLMWIISFPVQVAQRAPLPARLTWLDGAGIVLWMIGFGCESLGDWQLARFKADPANRGKVMDRGLWAYTRHPNYFGDAVVWWGLFVIAAATPGGIYTVVSPAVMTFLLMRVSGVPMLERTIVKRRPDYAGYARRTSAFVPWPPRR